MRHATSFEDLSREERLPARAAPLPLEFPGAHYIDEAEEMADRIGVINKGELIVVENKIELMKKLGKKQLTLNLLEPLASIPLELSDWRLALKNHGTELEYTFDGSEERTGVPTLLKRLSEMAIEFKDLNTRQSSLEDIFVDLVSDRK